MAVVDDMKMCVAELEQENQIPTVSIEALDGEVARVFMSSPRSEVCQPFWLVTLVLSAEIAKHFVRLI